jgi:Tfp pilus assembly pilus retraction ATPase PilT
MDYLKNIDFTDLIFDKNDMVFIKNMAGEKVDSLSPVPTELNADIQNLKEKIISKSKNFSEFAIDHDGIRYRVAKSRDENVFFVRKGVMFIPTLKENGMEPALIRQILLHKRKHGLLLVSGQQGSGKTRTASSIVYEKLKRFGGLAVTIEDPPELPLHGQIGPGFCVQQNVVAEKVSEAIVQAMRFASPNIIFLGELREGEMASEAIRAAINGHLIVATVHASGVTETIERIAVLAKNKDGDAAYTLLSEGLFAVLHQKLVGERLPRKLDVEFLFATTSVSAMIREKKIYQVSTEITVQKNKLYRQKIF